jgi:hypothetical protein
MAPSFANKKSIRVQSQIRTYRGRQNIITKCALHSLLYLGSGSCFRPLRKVRNDCVAYLPGASSNRHELTLPYLK